MAEDYKYDDSVKAGIEDFTQQSGYAPTPMVMGPAGPAYWIARRAARHAAARFLELAEEMGHTEGQLDQFREVAEEVAYD